MILKFFIQNYDILVDAMDMLQKLFPVVEEKEPFDEVLRIVEYKLCLFLLIKSHGFANFG
tara:strand:- start:1059 stop:1238 length:180 start_codon:yes stop_codon:yes gene_type:complete